MVYHSSFHQATDRDVLCPTCRVVIDARLVQPAAPRMICPECRVIVDTEWAPCPWCSNTEPKLGPEPERPPYLV